MVTQTVAPPRERFENRNGQGRGDAWKVVVLNDNHNTFEGVAFTLSSVLPGVTYDAGMQLANRVHFSGRAVVWSGHQELAELYWSQLETFGLTLAPLGS